MPNKPSRRPPLANLHACSEDNTNRGIDKRPGKAEEKKEKELGFVIGTLCRMIHGTKERNWGMCVCLMQMLGTVVLSVDNRV